MTPKEKKAIATFMQIMLNDAFPLESAMFIKEIQNDDNGTDEPFKNTKWESPEWARVRTAYELSKCIKVFENNGTV